MTGYGSEFLENHFAYGAQISCPLGHIGGIQHSRSTALVKLKLAAANTGNYHSRSSTLGKVKLNFVTDNNTGSQHAHSAALEKVQLSVITAADNNTAGNQHGSCSNATPDPPALKFKILAGTYTPIINTSYIYIQYVTDLVKTHVQRRFIVSETIILLCGCWRYIFHDVSEFNVIISDKTMIPLSYALGCGIFYNRSAAAGTTMFPYSKTTPDTHWSSFHRYQLIHRGEKGSDAYPPDPVRVKLIIGRDAATSPPVQDATATSSSSTTPAPSIPVADNVANTNAEACAADSVPLDDSLVAQSNNTAAATATAIATATATATATAAAAAITTAAAAAVATVTAIAAATSNMATLSTRTAHFRARHKPTIDVAAEEEIHYVNVVRLQRALCGLRQAGYGYAWIQPLCHQLEEHFEIVYDGEADWCVGMGIDHNSDGSITLHQSKYIDDMLHNFNMTDANPVSTPMAAGYDGNADSPPVSDDTLYASLVGSINYAAACTRPDISYSVSVLSKHLKNHILRIIGRLPSVSCAI